MARSSSRSLFQSEWASSINVLPKAERSRYVKISSEIWPVILSGDHPFLCDALNEFDNTLPSHICYDVPAGTIAHEWPKFSGQWVAGEPRGPSPKDKHTRHCFVSPPLPLPRRLANASRVGNARSASSTLSGSFHCTGQMILRINGQPYYPAAGPMSSQVIGSVLPPMQTPSREFSIHNQVGRVSYTPTIH